MEIHKECIETNAVKFLSWTMLVLSNMGTAAKQQFFYLSLLLEGTWTRCSDRNVIVSWLRIAPHDLPLTEVETMK